MNEVLKAIKGRRTTRAFLGEQITKVELDAIIEAGLYAPSAHNHQPWHFTVVQDEKILNELNFEAKEAAKNFPDEMIKKMASNPDFNIFYNAPTLILVSGDKNGMMPETDCAAASQNMLLAAESLGLGACWNGMISFVFGGEKKDEYINKLKVPDNFKPYYGIIVGKKKVNVVNAPARKTGTVTYL